MGAAIRAIQTLEPVAARYRTNASVHATLAEAYVRKYLSTPDKNWLEKAVESGRQAILIDHDLVAGHVALAMVLAASAAPPLRLSETSIP